MSILCFSTYFSSGQRATGFLLLLLFFLSFLLTGSGGGGSGWVGRGEGVILKG